MKMLRTTQSQNKINILFQLWRRYDADNSGYIEADELKVGLWVASAAAMA